MHTTIDVTPIEPNQRIAICGETESVEDLLYEFIRDRTPLTGRSYYQDLKAFFAFTNEYFNTPRVDGSKVHFEDIKRVHVVKYKNFLETEPTKKTGKPFAPNSINRKISSISSFYQFLLQRELVEKNPVEFCIRPKRICVRETEAFTDREMKHLVELVLEKGSPLHKAIILTMFTTGMRNAEVRNIKLVDIQVHEGIKVLRYVGKGQKLNQVPLHPATAHYVDEYIAAMARKGRAIGGEDYLFQPAKNSTGPLKKKLSHTALSYIVKKWAKRVNPSKRITPHSARATFISSLLDSGEDIYSVAMSVGHADVYVPTSIMFPVAC